MILKALYDFYNSHPELPPIGYEAKEISYIIVIGRQGEFRRFESKIINNKRATPFIVPMAKKRTVGITPNYLWDNGGYVLGMPAGARNVAEKNCAFIEAMTEIGRLNPGSKEMEAIIRFYQTPFEKLQKLYSADALYDSVVEDIAKNFSFQIEGDDEIIAEKRSLVLPDDSDSKQKGICLITGERSLLARLTTATPLPGNSPAAAIVSMQTNSGYDSYGKEQAFNAPISTKAEFAYSTALKSLLDKDSKNKFRVGSRIFLFWASNSSNTTKEAENSLFKFVSFEFEKNNDSNATIGKIDKFFKSVWSGQISTDFDDRFYILGLAPNVGRIAVVSWADMTLKEFAGQLIRHFDDMEIFSSRKHEEQKLSYKGIFSMLATTTIKDKAGDALPNLPEALVDAVLNGRNYPVALYTIVLERIRADLSKSTVSQGRAAILKAFLNRKYRNNPNIKQLNIMLDTTYDNPGYLCGRLAAVLEKIQEDVKSGDTIRTRYLAAASATPSIVFPTILNLSIHHSEKLSEKSQVFYDKLKQEIIDKLMATGFPAHLDLNDQGRFFVGYYHQRSDFFKPRNSDK